ncbi:MAG: Nif3-like dinuclear metal center hexameric protein [Polaromonas sp.]|jgi:dinuclear metal center YbgI/SA1388 family protein|nr:Nif3-like dinuclear metal center hexameric protein [Polaromonas sp.]
MTAVVPGPAVSPHRPDGASSAGATSPDAACASRGELLQALDDLLEPARFKDYGPNGLQVEGKEQIRTVISGVTASLALIEAAVAARADAIFVHHGLFWRGRDGSNIGPVTGWMKQRLALLLAHDINLFAYHLPLDAHAELGNNAQLAIELGLQAFDGDKGRFGDQRLGFIGSLADGSSTTASVLAERIEFKLKRPVAQVSQRVGAIKTIAWCSGGAQGYFEDAIAAGADVFITGEISEPQAHYARETGVAFIACGHHASERYGAPAVAGHIAARFGITHAFIDIDNPA